MLWSSFFAALTSLVLCPTNSSHLGLSELQSLLPLLIGVVDAIIGLTSFASFL